MGEPCFECHAPSHKRPCRCDTDATIARLTAERDDMASELRNLADIIDRAFSENDLGIDRVLIDGEYHTGVVVDHYCKTLRLMRDIMRKAASGHVSVDTDAIAAAAFEAAAEAIGEIQCKIGDTKHYWACQDTVRSLTPADSRAALDRMLRQAKAEAWKDVAEWIRPQRIDVPATGEEFAQSILARAAEIEAGQ